MLQYTSSMLSGVHVKQATKEKIHKRFFRHHNDIALTQWLVTAADIKYKKT